MFLIVLIIIGLVFGWKAAAILALPLLGVQAVASVSELGRRD